MSDKKFYDAAMDALQGVNGYDNNTEAMISVARKFLTNSSAPHPPLLLEVLETHHDTKSASDRLVKIGRNVSSTMKFAAARLQHQQEEAAATGEEKGDEVNIPNNIEKINASLSLLVEESSNLATLLKGGNKKKVPKVRFGKTELQMPVVTLGCMRFQQSWNRGDAPELDMSRVEEECQENLVEIIRYAYQCGVTHIETAKMYGTSQIQIGDALKKIFGEGTIKREDLIIQTKGGVVAGWTIKDYKEDVLKSLKLLQLDYVDLFSVHGLNTQQHYDLLFDNGGENLIVALQELKKEGKIRHIGFSTHGPADLIQRAIETDAFEYLNLHYHFCGSYTASGDLDCGGNLSNIRLAHAKDMGVFVISAYDKGGRLYAPSNKLRDLCLPDMEPMTYGTVWLWQHAMHDEQKAPIHTLVVGAARPSDLDQPVLASHLLLLQDQKILIEKRQRITDRLTRAMEDALGKDWVEDWHVGVPNAHTSRYQTHLTGIVWQHNLIKAWGMLDYAKDRYGPMENHLKNWDINRTKEENIQKLGPGFGWMPGTAIVPSLDYTQDFKNCPKENKEKLMEAIQFVYDWVAKKKDEEGGNQKKRKVPFEWETAYDMRPWTAFPER